MTTTRPLLISAVTGFLAGLAIAGLPGSAVICPLALAVWLRATPPLGFTLSIGTSMTFGGFAAAASERWVPGGVEALTGSFGLGLGVAFALAITHGAIPWLVIGGARIATRRGSALGRLVASSLTVFVVESIVSRGGFAIPWVLLGHAQSPDVFGWAPLAAVGGVPMISSATMAFASGLAESIDASSPRERRAVASIVVALGLFPFVHAMTAREAPVSDETLLVVQPNFPRSARWRPERQAIHLDRIAAHTARAIEAQTPKPGRVLWPENVVTPWPDARDPRPSIVAWATRFGVPVITGVALPLPSASGPRYSNVVVRAYPDARPPSTTPKRIGVPFFETDDFLGFHLERLVDALSPDFRAAPRMRSPLPPPARRETGAIAAVLCFEALFPAEVARRRSAGARAIATLADDSWIPSYEGSEQLTRYSAFRALEQGLPHVRVAHGGRSVIHDARGRTLETLPRDAWGAMSLALPTRADPTVCAEACNAGGASALAGIAAVRLARRWHRGTRGRSGRTRGRTR